MPYIKTEDRTKYGIHLQYLADIIKEIPEEKLAGELNYLLTSILHIATEKANYRKFNEIIGVLECCKLEMYRRKISPYEDKKIIENGDV